MEAGARAYQLYVGVDVAAETFVAAWRAPGGQPGAPFTGEQTPAGFAALQRRLHGDGEAAGRHAGGAGGDRQLRAPFHGACNPLPQGGQVRKDTCGPTTDLAAKAKGDNSMSSKRGRTEGV